MTHQLSEIKIIPINWSSIQLPNNECTYHHLIGECGLGKFLITWKGHKEHPRYDIEDSPVPFPYEVFYDLDDAKQACQRFLNTVILNCIQL